MVKKIKPFCLGLNSVLPKIHVHPDPQKVNLLGASIFVVVIKVRIKM